VPGETPAHAVLRVVPRRRSAMLSAVETKKPIEKVREDLTRACANHKFGVLGVHDLKAKMKEKGVEFGGECLIFEVCNPNQAKKVLETNPDISTALPCRISVYKTKEGRTRIATLKPSELISAFGTTELQGVAREVEATLESIMQEAAALA
jgi:uncharacterized protein (DUF302 family)